MKYLRSGRRFVLDVQGNRRRCRCIPGPRRAGISMWVMIELGFFVRLENPRTGRISYLDTPRAVYQALRVYGKHLVEMDEGERQHFDDLKRLYEAVYGPM